MPLDVTPAAAHPSKWSTIADLENLGGAAHLAMSQQYVNGIEALRLASLFPLGYRAGAANDCEKTGFVFGGDVNVIGSNYHAKTPKTYVAFSNSASLALTTGQPGASAVSSTAYVYLYTNGTTVTATWNDGASYTGNLPASIKIPNDAIYSAYSGKYIVVGANGFWGRILSTTATGASQSWSLDYDSSGNPGGQTDHILQRIAGNSNGQKLLVGSFTSAMGCMYSGDGGASWTRRSASVGTNPNYFSVMGVGYDTITDGWVACGTAFTDLLVKRSTDNGVSWSQIGTIPNASAVDMCAIPGGMFLILATVSSVRHLYGSVDGGQTWRDMGEVPGATRVLYSNGYVIIPGSPNAWVSRLIL